MASIEELKEKIKADLNRLGKRKGGYSSGGSRGTELGDDAQRIITEDVIGEIQDWLRGYIKDLEDIERKTGQ